MAQVLVCDLDDSVVEKLTERAKSRGRTLEDELRLIFEQAASGWHGQSALPVEQIQKLFAGRTFSDSADLLREDRDR